MRLELSLLAAGLLCWLAALLVGLGGPPEAGLLPVDLYPLYGLAAFLGWLSGNGFVLRSRGRARRLFWMAYLVPPAGLFVLLWTLAPAAVRTAAPLAPVWAWGVFLVLFLVPVTFRRRT
jgi:hypothetical protein